MTITTDFQLQEIAKKEGLQLYPVVAKDELKTMEANDGNYIINLQNSNGMGTHWTAFIIRGKSAFYFDSFGAVPPKELIKFLKKIPDAVIGYNAQMIQDIKSTNCGFYCLMFLDYMKNTKEPALFARAKGFFNKYFVDDTIQNDKRLNQYLIKRFTKTIRK